MSGLQDLPQHQQAQQCRPVTESSQLGRGGRGDGDMSHPKFDSEDRHPPSVFSQYTYLTTFTYNFQEDEDHTFTFYWLWRIQILSMLTRRVVVTTTYAETKSRPRL